MNLRQMVNSVTHTINPNETVKILRSSGFTMGAGARQVPKYTKAVSTPAQIQALDSDDLKQIDGLNLQGTIRAIYINGELKGTSKPGQVGGDMIKRKGDSEVWLVVKILEAWPNWCKAVIVLQADQ